MVFVALDGVRTLSLLTKAGHGEGWWRPDENL